MLPILAPLVALSLPAADSAPLVIREGVALSGAVRGGRIPFERDPVQAALARGTFSEPMAGEGGWTTIKAGDDGVFNGLRGAYVWTTVEVPEAGVYLLNARGNSVAYVNGVPRPGDVYSYGYLPLPVNLKKGRNALLFYAGRGTLAASLTKAEKLAQLNPADTTLPDFLVGEKKVLLGALPVLNNTEKALTGLTLAATTEGGRTVISKLPAIPPMTARKVAFSLTPGTGTKLSVVLRDAKGTALDETVLSVRTRKPGETHRKTFVSEIDGSVQYWAAFPSTKPNPGNALVLSLHGASVEAQGQADAYGPHDDVSLAAATNRRPYGFDWEDWGRADAIEVLAQAKGYFPHDPARVNLTGHSMGGHGTWSLASLLPGTFASAAPSAGWISFTTYVGAPPPNTTDLLGKLFASANLPSDTLSFLPNLLQARIYAIHGDADDNVPVTEARRMREELTKIGHPSVGWYEEKGADHWWDNDPAPGAACVDFPAAFQMIRDARIPSGPGPLRFVTANPSVSSTDRWLTIEQQLQPLALSEANLDWEGDSVIGTTSNVRRLSLDIPKLARVTLDGQTLRVSGRPVRLVRDGSEWSIATKPVSSAEKNPLRYGPFKRAFDHRMLFVYGTAGSPDENAWSAEKARYDSEAFLYRGNGAPEVLSDREFLARKTTGRSVILYGNADTNAAWNMLLKNAPIQLTRTSALVGKTQKTGADLACLFAYPRPGSKTAMVGVVGGTGLVGCRTTNRLAYFSAGVAYPDWCVFTPDVFQNGIGGAVGAGIFGNDWRVETGQSAWR